MLHEARLSLMAERISRVVRDQRERRREEPAGRTQLEYHRYVRPALLELDHARAAGRTGEHRARDLERYVTEKENTGAEAEDAVVESQVGAHAESGVCHAGAVNIVGHVEDEQEGEQPQSNSTPSAITDFIFSRHNGGKGFHGQTQRPL